MAMFDDGVRDQLVSAITARLLARRSSAFEALGESICRPQVEAALVAFEQDVESGRHEAVRATTPALLDTLLPAGLTFSDLRFACAVLREHVSPVVPEPYRTAAGEWFYEHLSVVTMAFMVRRDAFMQRQAAERELERFEHQLAELEVALADKTRLLEAIRQASIPIATVASGILVVPLVGVFDSVRAQLLTEQLLDDVVRLRARSTIIDISGVPVFDTDAAQLIIRLACAVQLLGAEVILVGMSADNARTIVDLGVDLSQLHTLGSLRAGLAQALDLQGLEIVRKRGP